MLEKTLTLKVSTSVAPHGSAALTIKDSAIYPVSSLVEKLIILL